MADEENEGGGPVEDARGLVAGDDEHVDESQMKLPAARLMTGRGETGEEGEEVAYKQ